MLIWDVGASFDLTPFWSILLTDGSTISSILGWHYISWQTPRDFKSIFLCFLTLTTDRCPFILSPTLPPNAWWLFWGQYWLHQDAVDNLCDSNTINEGEILSSRCIWFIRLSFREVVGFFNRLWLMPHLTQCTQFLPSCFFSRSTYLCTFKYLQSQTLFAFQWSVCWCMRISTFLNFRRNFSNGISGH